MGDRAIRRGTPWMTEVIEGEPIRVGERELVPVVRVTTYRKRQALVGTDRLAGRVWCFVRLRPTAILERDRAGERRLPIRDNTAQALSGLLLAAFVIPLLLAAAVRLARKVGH
jgi:hypothetical protein